MVIDINNTSNNYGIIYTDPPWQQTKGNYRKSRPNQGKELDYPTLSIEKIKQIHSSLPVKEKYNIFMWTIDKYLHQTESMMKELGYELHARIIWDKCNGIAPAFTLRYTHQYLLWFYKKGHMLMPCKETRGKYTTILRELATKHSKKPLCAYKMIEDMFPNENKLEMFARELRDGWDCWGNEVNID